MKPKSTRLTIAAFVVSLTLLLPSVASGSNFGSGINHACDTTTAAQCIANNGTHVYCYSSVAANIVSNSDTVIAAEYSPLSSISTTKVACTDPNAAVDLTFYDGEYATPWWAWTACAGGATYGGTNPHRWCKPQSLYWDRSNLNDWNTTAGRKYVACHEFGHSLGLRHTSNTASCMFPDQITTDDLTAHDQAMLNNWYGNQSLLPPEP